MLPSKFVIMFDGWTEGSERDIGLTVSYVSEPLRDNNAGAEITAGQVTQSLLSMPPPPLVDEVEKMTANDHVIHLSKVLAMYGKVIEDILCMIGNNCSMN